MKYFILDEVESDIVALQNKIIGKIIHREFPIINTRLGTKHIKALK
jgi:hypothetical protein